ncbi:acyltransferase family protein [Sphingomonas faeni]|uniref:acyltransferase family protein n=1 Tax=Sphingomonas faeni TaxID=185950 RepID=UPI0027886B65|nr:acyltransferase family protein [Sphingomonas faeni]MDQ0838823.1 peptidoglycan/LPS O-acetylase OafA/YrhL [Sphingomonas faeni]
MAYTIEIVVAVGLALIAANLCGRVIAGIGFPLPEGRRIGHIDSLRGFLGVSVMCHHFVVWMSAKANGSWNEPQVPFFNQLGQGSVALFFMITGLVFYPRVLAGFRNVSWSQLYMKRIFRIVPLLLLSILIVSAVIATTTNLRPTVRYPLEVVSWISGKQTLDIFGFRQSKMVNASVLWSIYYEWIFYFVVLPVCAFARLFVGNRTWLVPVALCVGGIIGRITDISLFTYIPLFALGMLAYELKSHAVVVRLMRSRPAAALACAWLLASVMIFRNPYSFAMPAFGFFFLAVVCGNSIFGIFGSTSSIVLGECSYGTYLLHGSLLYLGFTLLRPETKPVIAMPLFAVAVTILTAFTYLLIERPGIITGSRLNAKLTYSRKKVAIAR